MPKTLFALRILTAALICLHFADPGVAQRPNIVFILADDLAWSDLVCYGNTVHDTPNIDRLASEGVRFTQAYAPAPICSASRAAILTGKFPARLNFEFVTKNEPGRQQLDVPLQTPSFTLNLPLEETTLGESLAAAGYTTGFFGKWHINQHYEGYLGWSPTYGPLQQGFSQGSSDFGSHPYAYRENRELKDKLVSEGTYPEDTLIENAVEFIEHPRDEPYFLYLSQYFVHDPVHSRCRWLVEKYRSRLPDNAPKVRPSYAAMVDTLDHLVGRVLDAIDRTGEKDNTLVVFMSDNGGHPNYTSNAPLRGSKWNLYEGGIRVPMLVRWPKVLAPGVCDDTAVHGCDLFPTFCEVAQAGAPSTVCDGVSLMPVLKNSAAELKRPSPLVWHFPYYHPETRFKKAPEQIGVGDFYTSQTRPHSAMREGDWKLLHFYEDDRSELYNLSTDLAEQVDLASQQPELTTRLKQQLEDRLLDMNARFPQSNGQ